jgi:dipeptidyl-peptidase-4
MNKARRPVVFVALIVAVVLAAPLRGADTPARRQFTYEQVFGAPAGPPVPAAAGGGLLGQLPAVRGWLDDAHYLEMRQDPSDKQMKVYSVGAADGAAAVHQPADAGGRPPGGLSVPGGRWTIALKGGDLFATDARSQATKQLTATAAAETNPRLSPSGTWVAYTRENNLFAYDLEHGLEHQYTSDGSDVILNGYASWVYMEEILGRATAYAAFWWSPDSTRLAFMRFDDSPVPVFPIYHADGQHGELERQRYPKAGDPNPWVQMGVVSVADGALAWMDFDARADHYIAWPVWTPDSKTLTVQWMNRGQDTLRLYNCDPVTGRKAMIFEEKQRAWVEFFEDLAYLEGGTGMLIRSNVDGWDHLYLYNMDGTLKKRLTSGAWRVDSIARVDEAAGYVYFVGRPGKTWDAQLMRVKLDGAGLETLTRGDGVHRPQLSPGATYFIDTVSTINTPAVMTLHTIDGALVRSLGDQKSAAMAEYAWGRGEMFTIPSEDGQFQLPAYWVLPPDFDAKNTKKRYPVIFTVYGGPNAGTVSNSWPSLQAHYWAQRGVITISVDHRASGHFGKKGVALMHRNLGKWEMADLIAAARWLRTKPFVATDRIGIAGGSYGGYTTTMALLYGAGHFNVGQAGAPVTDWQLYDSVYTERYMDTPAENPEGYRAGAALTWADRYAGGLRLTHGTIDDNVHMQNTIQVVDWMVSHDKRFELMLYPDSRHGTQASQRAHATRESHDFWMRTLLARAPGGER